MRIVICGGTGYVGARLTSALMAAGHEVAVISRSSGVTEAGPARILYEGESQGLARDLLAWRPDYAVHLAADVRKGHSPADVDALVASNVTFPMHFVNACIEAKVKRFVNISTFSTFSRPDEYSPQTFYAATKRATEDLLTFFHQAELLEVCSLCFYDVYGPGQAHQRFLPALIRSIQSGEAMTMSKGEQEICFLHVDDAVEAVRTALFSDSAWSDSDSNIFTVYGDEVLILRDVPGIVAQAAGLALPEVMPTLPYRPREIMRFAPPYDRLPGWKPNIHFRTGVAAILQGQSTLA
jgi:nucleoside-diphosphate-sugar epimerase